MGNIDIATSPDADELRKRVFCDALAWTEEEGGSVIVGGKDNRVVGLSSFLLFVISHCLFSSPFYISFFCSC
jgi:hypothetical protein